MLKSWFDTLPIVTIPVTIFSLAQRYLISRTVDRWCEELGRGIVDIVVPDRLR